MAYISRLISGHVDSVSNNSLRDGLTVFFGSEFRRYLVASGIAFCIDFGTLFLLTSLHGVYYLKAAAIGFLLGLICIYLLSVTWVFRTRKLRNIWTEFLVFSLVGIGGLCVNELSMYLFTSLLGIYYLGAKVLSAFLVFSWNYGARKITLFS